VHVIWFLLTSGVWSLALLGLVGVVLDIISSSGLNCSIALVIGALLLIVGSWRRWHRPYCVAVVGGLSTLGLVVLLAAGDWSVTATLFVIGSSAHAAFLGIRAACARTSHGQRVTRQAVQR
jgi:hypothetical protein